jgi:hypothetical protein
MSLTLKQRFARLDMSKLPKSYTDEFDIMDKETSGFSDEDMNKIFEENFNDLYELAEKKYPDAIKSGGTVTKEKPSKVKTVKAKGPKKLPEVEYNGKKYFVDFRLQEVRDVKTAESTPFKDIKGSEFKAAIRFLRAESGPNEYMKGLDDDKDEIIDRAKRKKLSEKDIMDIEGAISVANDEKTSDAILVNELINDFGISRVQSEKWVSKREKYKELPYGDYRWRTEKKKEARKGSDIVKTRDDKEIDRKSNKNIGKTFYDDNGKAWKCKGYNAKLDECVLEDADGKEISSCIKDMYTTNPVTKREKGSLVDECRETLKEAGFTVKEHKAGNKKIKRSEPRPEKVIIKERVEETFTPITKDLKGSEEKETENKEILAVLDNIQGLFTKFMSRISNLADDGKIEKLKKIEKLLKEIVE